MWFLYTELSASFSRLSLKRQSSAVRTATAVNSNKNWCLLARSFLRFHCAPAGILLGLWARYFRSLIKCYGTNNGGLRFYLLSLYFHRIYFLKFSFLVKKPMSGGDMGRDLFSSRLYFDKCTNFHIIISLEDFSVSEYTQYFYSYYNKLWSYRERFQLLCFPPPPTHTN
jgi:hypothetical protein